MVRLPRNEKQTYRLNSRAQMWPSGLTLAMTLTSLNFQGQIWNFLYLSQKWSDCHETKSKHIDWTLGLKCDHRVWPWPWPWPPWIFKVKYGISYVSVKSGPIATKRKANISIELQASNVTNGMDLPDSDWGDFSCRRAVDSSSYSKDYLRATNFTLIWLVLMTSYRNFNFNSQHFIKHHWL